VCEPIIARNKRAVIGSHAHDVTVWHKFIIGIGNFVNLTPGLGLGLDTFGLGLGLDTFGLGLGLGLDAIGLGLDLGLDTPGLGIPGLVNIPDLNVNRSLVSVFQLFTVLCRDPLKNHPDVYPEAVFGPSVRFGGFRAQWTGESFSRRGEVAVETRVSFETYAGERTMSFLEIVNDGTTSIYYSWKVTKLGSSRK
jgi:hypothetical protein